MDARGDTRAHAQPLAVDPTDIARLGSMSVRARVIVEGAFAGMHQNPHAGSSIEFSEHKEDAPGDDTRRIDWKAVGRVDRYYIKRFEDETEMRTFLLIDSSASMGDGRKGVTKLACATSRAGALAYLLAQQGDPAGLMLFDEKTRQYLPPRTRGGHIRDLLVALEAAHPAGRTEPGRALAEIGEIADRRSLIVVFSDLLDAPVDLADRLRQIRSRGNDVVLFHLMDHDEVELPYDRVTEFEGMEPEDARRLLVDPRDLAASFRRESAALRERWRQACLEARAEDRFAATA